MRTTDSIISQSNNPQKRSPKWQPTIWLKNILLTDTSALCSFSHGSYWKFVNQILDIGRQILDKQRQVFDVARQILDIPRQMLDKQRQILDIARQRNTIITLRFFLLTHVRSIENPNSRNITVTKYSVWWCISRPIETANRATRPQLEVV